MAKKGNKKSKEITFLELINKLMELLPKKTVAELGKMILELIVIFVFIALLKIPFILVRDTIIGLLTSLSTETYRAWASIFTNTFELFYVFVAIWVFIAIFKSRFILYIKDVKNQ